MADDAPSPVAHRELSAPPRRPRAIAWLVFALSFSALLAIAGRSALAPSDNPHYLYMAKGWLEGRLALEGDPPGWCSPEARREGRCRHHQHDDWALVWTLELRDGSRFRGQPCRSQACREGHERGHEAWLDMRGATHSIPRAQILERQRRWYVSFPPGPAALMLPFVALGGLAVWDVLLTALAAALASLLLLRGLDRFVGEAARSHLWIVAAWSLASPALFVGAHGSVWFTAQTLGALFTIAYIFDAHRAEHPLRAGAWLALAMSCRPHLILGALWFVQQLGQRHGRGRVAGVALLRFALPILIVGAAMAALNFARFDSPFEFGHRFLDIRWQARMQSIGQFDPSYLPRNLECLLWLMPQARAEFPWFALSLHGSALWLMSPWLVALAGLRRGWRRYAGLWVAAVLIALPPLLYHNSGQRQLSYRFALDWLPYLLPLIAMSAWSRTRLFRAAVLAGALLSGLAAWYFDRDPARIFVVEPLGWPFEDELQTRP